MPALPAGPSASDRETTPTDIYQLFCAFTCAGLVVLNHTRTVHAQDFRRGEMIGAVANAS
jgi:hypothetical protein